MRVEIFTGLGSGKLLQEEINTWMEESGLDPEDVFTVTQSECGTSENGQVTISIWYSPRLPQPKLSEDEAPF